MNRLFEAVDNLNEYTWDSKYYLDIPKLTKDVYNAIKPYWTTVYSDEWFDEKDLDIDTSLADDIFNKITVRFGIRKDLFTQSPYKVKNGIKENLKQLGFTKISIRTSREEIPFKDNRVFYVISKISFELGDYLKK